MELSTRYYINAQGVLIGISPYFTYQVTGANQLKHLIGTPIFKL